MPAGEPRRRRASSGAMPLASALLLSTALHVASACPGVVRELRVPTPAGHVIAARLALPRGASRAPVVVMISGAGPQDRDYGTTIGRGEYANHFFARVEERLGCAAIGALRFDEVGTGQSTGSYQDVATTRTLADDVAAIVDALRREPGVDSARIALLGHSEGGAIAAIVAASRPAVAAVALLAAPVERGLDVMRFQIAAEERSSAADGAAARDEHARRAATDRWYRFFLDFSPAPFYARLRQPVLVLQGALDRQVTPAQADSIVRLARGAGNRFVYCRRYPGHGHALEGNEPRPFSPAPEVLDDVVRFTRLVLVAKRPPSSGGACRHEARGAFWSAARTPNRAASGR